MNLIGLGSIQVSYLDSIFFQRPDPDHRYPDPQPIVKYKYMSEAQLLDNNQGQMI